MLLIYENLASFYVGGGSFDILVFSTTADFSQNHVIGTVPPIEQ